MTEDIKLSKLKIINNVDGDVLHALKKSSIDFKNFGEAYFSEVKYGSIKGWKRHRIMTLNLVVPVGEIKFVAYDDRNRESPFFKEFVLSRYNFFRLTVPPMIWLGFKGMCKNGSMLLNIADIEHDPSESDNLQLDEINYKWTDK